MVLVWRGHESADGGARPLPSTMACRRPSPCGAAISIPKQRLLRVRHGEAAGPGLREPQRQLTLPPATRPRPQTHGSTPNLHPEPRSRPVAHLHPKLHLETAVRLRPCPPLLDLCGRSGSDLCPPTNSLVLARVASATRTTSRPLVAGAPSSQVSPDEGKRLASICCTHLGCSSLGGNGAATAMGQAAIRGQNSHRANEIFRFRVPDHGPAQPARAAHTAFSHPGSAQLQSSRLPRVHQLEPCGAPKSRFLVDLRKTETPLHIAACFAHRKTRRRWRRSRSRRSARTAAARLLVSDFSNLYMASRFHIISPSMTLEINPEFSHYLRLNWPPADEPATTNFDG